ncbi:MAG: hypothetical protein HKN47_04925 [Pirellulaceae bacterium]|nr:hypothetical protein [Pirellulaceae bacterium]
MSHHGQCPTCRTLYELDDDDVGMVFECECGSTLFAADVAGFNEIPVFCSQCDGEYVVDSDGAGEVVECECGAQLTVPTVVLRAPVSSRGESAADALAVATSTASDPKAALAKGERLITCPECSSPFVVTRSDLGVDSQCDCGCVFAAQVNEAKKVVAVKVQNGADEVGSHAPRRQRPSEPSDHDETTQRKKKRSPIALFGIGFVVLLLLFSVTMFALRQAGMLTKQKVAQKPRQAVTIPPIGGDIAIAASDASDDANGEIVEPSGPSTSSAQLPDSTQGSGDDVDAEMNTNVLIANEPTVNDPAAAASPSRDPGRVDRSPPPPRATQFAPPSKQALPPAKPARPIVPIIASESRGLTFARAYQEAYDSYENAKKLEAESAQSDDNAAYHEQLGKAIGQLQATLAIGSKQKTNDQLDSLRYMLAYCYFRAGRLPEASVLGEAVGRWGDKKEASTKNAIMIALAATQEANQNHWGLPEQVGELDRMRSIVDVFAKRWPEDPQLDPIRLNLAQLYDKFGHPFKAASVYRLIPKTSPHYATSQLAAGSALWAEYRIQAAENENPSAQQKTRNNQILSQARNFLSQGVKSLTEKQSEPTQNVLVAKLNLARIELSAGKLQAAQQWLTGKPMPVTESISIDGSGDTVKVSVSFLRLVYETLFSIRTQLNDGTGANETLMELASKLGEEHSADLGRLFLSVATDYIDQLSQQSIITRDQLSNLADLIEPLKQQNSTLTASNIMWLGESWSKLAPRAADANLKQLCFQKAAAAYELAMSRDDFPESSRQGALLRHAQLLRGAGRLDEAIVSLGDILEQTPNAFGLQIEAAEALQQSAIDANDPLSLTDAVDGPTDSPIWGWNKLVTTLHGIRFSDNADAKNTERLMKCQFHLAQCKWLIARATPDQTLKGQRVAELQRLLTRMKTSIKPGAEPWFTRMNELIEQVNQQFGGATPSEPSL